MKTKRFPAAARSQVRSGTSMVCPLKGASSSRGNIWRGFCQLPLLPWNTTQSQVSPALFCRPFELHLQLMNMSQYAIASYVLAILHLKKFSYVKYIVFLDSVYSQSRECSERMGMLTFVSICRGFLYFQKDCISNFILKQLITKPTIQIPSRFYTKYFLKKLEISVHAFYIKSKLVQQQNNHQFHGK